ncbi:hypothetical protein VTK26DRAFT_8688 [Humicola hyalothermophila]
MDKSSRSQGSASSIEEDLHLQSKMRTIHTVDAARAGTTMLALLMGLSALAVSGNTLRVYNETHVPREYLLPLWPDDFNIRPTVALVIGSAIVLVSNMVALSCSQVRSLRTNTFLHTSTVLASPLVGLAAALVAVAFYYAVNASDSADTIVSWTCRWNDIPMSRQPHWRSLCRQSRAGLYLAVVLIPVEAVALGLAAVLLKTERYTERYLGARKTPVLG